MDTEVVAVVGPFAGAVFGWVGAVLLQGSNQKHAERMVRLARFEDSKRQLYADMLNAANYAKRQIELLISLEQGINVQASWVAADRSLSSLYEFEGPAQLMSGTVFRAFSDLKDLLHRFMTDRGNLELARRARSAVVESNDACVAAMRADLSLDV